jgi:hypothetical protein
MGLVQTSSVNDKLVNFDILKKLNYKVSINFSLIALLYLYVYLHVLRGLNEAVWFNHIFVNNLNLNLIALILLVGCLINFSVKFIKIDNNVNNNDYYFSIFNILLISPFLFLSNSFYNFLFVIELISSLIFYKFVVSKF